MPGPQRDAARTRARLLEAAAECFAENGVGVSLQTVARAAKVSKGGLLHHFPTREDLLEALMRHLLSQFDQLVEDELAAAPEDTAPGRLVRAYVRAVFDELRHHERTREQLVLMGMLGTSPAVSEFLVEDDAAWKARIATDGIDPLRAEVIVKAADGATASLVWSRNSPEYYEQLRDVLIALTYEPGPVVVREH